MKIFRLIQSGFCDAATNMAIDEALLLSYKEGSSVPVLRLYGWRPPAISIGASQNPQKILDLNAIEKAGIDFIRRPTGGGVIFHDDEITYSIVASQNALGISTGIKKSFETITSFLFKAYQKLGVTACFAKDIYGRQIDAHLIADFCFSRKEEYDIIVGTKKIGGNAQKRNKNILLQHGSIPLTFNKDKAVQFLHDKKMADCLDITSINEISKKGKIDFNEMGEILTSAFSKHFKAKLEHCSLTNEEEQLAVHLKTSKYASPEWNLYRNK